MGGGPLHDASSCRCGGSIIIDDRNIVALGKWEYLRNRQGVNGQEGVCYCAGSEASSRAFMLMYSIASSRFQRRCLKDPHDLVLGNHNARGASSHILYLDPSLLALTKSCGPERRTAVNTSSNRLQLPPKSATTTTKQLGI